MFIAENTVEKRVFLAAGRKIRFSSFTQHCTTLAISRLPLDNRFRLLETTENLPRETRLPNYSSVAHAKCFVDAKKSRTQEPVENVHKKAFASGSHYEKNSLSIYLMT